jgi:hypothetical protein
MTVYPKLYRLTISRESDHFVWSHRNLAVLEEAIGIVERIRVSGNSVIARLDTVDLSIDFLSKSGLCLARNELRRLIGREIGILRTDASSVAIRELSRRPRPAAQASR